MIDIIKVFYPATEDTDLSNKLRELTKLLKDKFSDCPSGGFGGAYGYGYNYENDVFMMHEFCWCEEDNCKWCSYNEPNFIFKPTNAKVWWYKYIGRSQETEGELPSNWLYDCTKSLLEKK